MAMFSLQELNDLEGRFVAEKKLLVDEALNKLCKKYSKLRDDLKKQQELELAALEVFVGSVFGIFL